LFAKSHKSEKKSEKKAKTREKIKGKKEDTMGNCLTTSQQFNTPIFDPDDFVLPASIPDARQKVQLLDILHHPQLCILFQGYLKSIFCDESLSFWIEVEQFRELPTVEQRKERADQIFEKYFNPNSKSEIVCGADMMQRLRAALQDCDKNMFDRIQQQVQQTMVDDSLPNFLTWQLYFDFISNSNTRRVFLGGIRRTESISQIQMYTQKFCSPGAISVN